MADIDREYLIHNWDPFAIRFPEGFFIEGIRWYGIAYVIGFIIAAFLLHIYYKKQRSPLDNDAQTSLLTYIILGTVLGGRFGYMLLYNFSDFVANPLAIFDFRNGGISGMSSHGGMLGICIALILFSHRHKIAFWKLTDIIVTIGPPGIFFGRIANYINGELWGKETTVPWAIIFRYSDGSLTAPRHPSQLYQAGLEGLLLTFYLQFRFWSSNPNKKHAYGQITGEFLIAYALLRVVGELYREPDAFVTLIFGLSRGTFYSTFMIIAGIIIIRFAHNKKS